MEVYGFTLCCATIHLSLSFTGLLDQTLLPEVVPEHQRGAAAGYQMLMDSVSWGLGSALGIAIGQKLIRSAQHL